MSSNNKFEKKSGAAPITGFDGARTVAIEKALVALCKASGEPAKAGDVAEKAEHPSKGAVRGHLEKLVAWGLVEKKELESGVGYYIAVEAKKSKKRKSKKAEETQE